MRETKQKCLNACISKSADFIGPDVKPTLKFLFAEDVDDHVIEIASKIVTRDAKSKTHAWFAEHIPSIIERDGKSAFERTRNRAILMKNDQKFEASKDQPPPVLSYIPLDKLRKHVSKFESYEVLEAAVKQVLEHSESYTGELEILDQFSDVNLSI